MSSSVVERAERCSKVADAAADESEVARRLAPSVVEALAADHLFTMCLPRAYGGDGASALDYVDAVSELARGDGAAGWCAAVQSTTSSMAAFLAPEVAASIYTSPSVISAGVFAPNARGTRVDGGYVLTGRWQWGSGTQHSEWVVGGALCDDDTQRVCFFRADDLDFHDTWYTSGLRGTGSLDFSVDDVFVPVERTIRPGVDKATVDEPLARFPNFTLLALGVAAAGIGIARRALDELADMASGKTPQFSSRTLAESGFAQAEFARARARFGAARAYLRDEVDAAWATSVAGDRVSVESRVAMRLAAAHAAVECVAAVDTAWMLAGGTAVYDTSVLGRCLRDIHVVTQHIMVAPKLNETLGKSLLGADFNPAMI